MSGPAETTQKPSDPRLAGDWPFKRDSLRLEAANGNAAALSYLSSIMACVELWDDLIDRDKPVSDSDINGLMVAMMVSLPSNEFFTLNKSYLLPLTVTCINAWMDSNELQKSDDKRLRQSAWWLKQMGVELYAAVSYLTGGFSHMRTVSLKARSILMHEDFENFEMEHGYA